MKQQDLVWVRFPFSSFDDSKIRPALIISNNEYNKKFDDILICAITSKLDEKKYTIQIDQNNLCSGNLPIKSRIRADKILQIDKKLIVKSFATIDNKTFDTLINEITSLIK
ncbi:MAG: type II toxin-antitoxin system PemK/MazF family toxin, partial [Candidatus Aenigmatarchaeota archaeon]